MKTIIRVIVIGFALSIAMAFMSCSKEPIENTESVESLIGDWMEYNLTVYSYNQPESGESVSTFNPPKTWSIDNYYEDGVLVPNIYTITIEDQITIISRIGSNFTIQGEGSLIEIIVDGEFMTFENISNESTGSTRFVIKLIRL